LTNNSWLCISKLSLAVSLVSAYESGAESDASGEENEFSEEESTSERSASSTRSNTTKAIEIATTSNEVEIDEFTVKEEMNQSDDSIHAKEMQDESQKCEAISEITQETKELPADHVKEVEATNESSKDALKSTYSNLIRSYFL
jgi:hypothetical protein